MSTTAKTLFIALLLFERPYKKHRVDDDLLLLQKMHQKKGMSRPPWSRQPG
jgi:hypothetical protein